MIVGFLDSPSEIAILVIVVLVLFGGSQIPKLAKNLGKAQQEFKKGLEQGQKESDAEPASTAPTQPPAEETVEQKLARLEQIDKAAKEQPS
jgi:sec-independent protein translocase protein TatA